LSAASASASGTEALTPVNRVPRLINRARHRAQVTL
jgi:hypothetical protein